MAELTHGVPACTIKHSYHNIPEIFYYLWKKQIMPRNSFQDYVFRLVIFHQSCCGLEAYPPMEALSQQERYRFCGLDFYRMLTVLMIADSKSYTLLRQKISDNCRVEFLSSQQKLIDEWNTEHEFWEKRREEQKKHEPK